MTSSFRLLSLLVLFASCNKEEHGHNMVSRKYQLSYGSDIRHKLDVCLPANRNTQTPFILLIHGGGWISGDKISMHGFQEQLLLKGIASASINYRYVSANVHYPDLMNDVNAALHFCQTKAAEWEIRNNKYLIGGASAGGHMALLYAYSYNQDNLISGVISAAGPTDFTDEVWMNYAASIGLMPAINFLANSTYTVPVDSQFVAASPVQNLKNVPTLMLHGDEDEVVFYSQSQRLSTALQQAGIQQKLYTIHGGKHDMGLTNPTIFGNLLKEMTEWIQEFGK